MSLECAGSQERQLNWRSVGTDCNWTDKCRNSNRSHTWMWWQMLELIVCKTSTNGSPETENSRLVDWVVVPLLFWVLASPLPLAWLQWWVERMLATLSRKFAPSQKWMVMTTKCFVKMKQKSNRNPGWTIHDQCQEYFTLGVWIIWNELEYLWVVNCMHIQ